MYLSSGRTRIIRDAVLALIAVAIAGTLITNSAQAAGVTAPFNQTLGVDVRYALDVNKFDDTKHPTKNVYVRCYVSDGAFEGAVRWRFGAEASGIWAYARQKEKTVYMRGWTCRLAESFVSKLGAGTFRKVTRGEIFSYSTLLHEALHVQGVHDERKAECLANDGIRWAAMNLFNIPKAEANRFSRIAFDLSRVTTSTNYHSVSGDCQRTLASHDWVDYIA